MSEQAPAEETPAVTEQVADETPIVDWEKRYNDLRPQYDRTAQEAAEYRRLVEGLGSQDDDTRRQAADALGIEFVDTEDDDTQYLDPSEQRLSALEQRIAAREAAEQQQAQAAADQARVDQAMTVVNTQLDGLKLDDETRDIVFAKSLTLPQTPEGLPDIEAAHASVIAYENARKTAWAATKRSGYVSPVGQPGTEAPDLDDPEQRVAYMARRLQDMDD